MYCTPSSTSSNNLMFSIRLLGSQSTVRRSTQAAIEQSASLEGQDNELEEEEGIESVIHVYM